MASTMVIKVRYFGTSKVKVGSRERYLKAPVDENGKLSFDMGGLREKICSTCCLPPGSDITLVYIDEDGDVVTLVDDDDLQDALRQRLKSFRIDVLMNDDKVYRKSSPKRSTQLMMDSDGSSLGSSNNSMETLWASTSSSAIHDHDDTSSDPTVACFRRNYSEAIGARMLHTGVGCGCNPITGPRFKSTIREDHNLCRVCITIRALGTMLMLLHSSSASDSASSKMWF